MDLFLLKVSMLDIQIGDMLVHFPVIVLLNHQINKHMSIYLVVFHVVKVLIVITDILTCGVSGEILVQII